MKKETFNAAVAWALILTVVGLSSICILGKIAFAINNILAIFK